MTSTSDLLSLGMPAAQALAEGFSSIAITAAGTTTTDATVCDNQNDVFTMTATGSDGIRINTNWPLLQPIFVLNTSASTGKVYPATGGNFNGGSTDAALSILTHKAALIMRVSTTSFVFINSG